MKIQTIQGDIRYQGATPCAGMVPMGMGDGFPTVQTNCKEAAVFNFSGREYCRDCYERRCNEARQMFRAARGRREDMTDAAKQQVAYFDMMARAS